MLSRPKTETSVRQVSIPQDAVDLLIQEHSKHPENQYMFPSLMTGEICHPDSEAGKAAKSQAGGLNVLSGALCPSPDISACGSRCGSTKNRKNKVAKKVVKARENPPESMDSSGILELLPRFELGTSSLPTNKKLLLLVVGYCALQF